MARRKKPRIGDVYELSTEAGLAYIQYTHLTEDELPLVRVLPGLYDSRPGDIASLVQQRECYFTYYVLPYALRDGDITLVSNEPIPERAREFPTMRKRWGADEVGLWLIGSAGIPHTPEGLQKMQRTRHLTTEQKRLSIDQICTHKGLVSDIVRGWTPERDDEFNQQAQPEKGTRKATEEPTESKAAQIEHFLYFRKKSNAKAAADRLRGKGWTVEVRKGADGKNWLALARQPAPIEDIEETGEELETLARDFDGEYDGWGAAVSERTATDSTIH